MCIWHFFLVVFIHGCSIIHFSPAPAPCIRWDLAEGEMSTEAKVFKTNPNSRDLKGWSCVCIGVFHESTESLTLLLEHGGDPSLRSAYNKNAWDLAKVLLVYLIFNIHNMLCYISRILK